MVEFFSSKVFYFEHKNYILGQLIKHGLYSSELCEVPSQYAKQQNNSTQNKLADNVCF